MNCTLDCDSFHIWDAYRHLTTLYISGYSYFIQNDDLQLQLNYGIIPVTAMVDATVTLVYDGADGRGQASVIGD